jgi:hypothetical protein
MVELPRGNIIEERRGGASVLATLVNEMIKLDSRGYIRCERTPAESMPRVGQVIVSNGTIAAAIHESSAILEGLEALIEIESDCLQLDCMLQLVEDVDTSRILDLHPTAKLIIESPEESKSSKWWQDVGSHSNAWTRSSKLPTIEASTEAPEFIKTKAASMVNKLTVSGKLLKPGCVYSNESDSMFTLAANLKSHGKPLLVISRKIREELVVAYGLPAEDCLWLSQKEAEGVQFVDIDAIKGTVYGFLEGNLRAVLLLDGLEYLANICGSSAVIEMVRELGDRMRFEDDCLLISFDRSAWDKSEAAQLIRAAPYLDSETIDAWNNDSESLLDHPLMAPPTEEELLRLADYLEQNTPDTFTKIEPEPFVEESSTSLLEHAEVEEIEIDELESTMAEIIEEQIDDIAVQNISKGPRKAQVVKRRRSRKAKSLNERDMRRAGLEAANSGAITSELPSSKSIPKTFTGRGRDGKMPSIPELIPNSLSDMVRQDSITKVRNLPATQLGPKSVSSIHEKKISVKDPISPTAARGVEVKRNESKRVRSSSVPQKELDIDKELQSWKFEEEAE